jgi:hypothetical protein
MTLLFCDSFDMTGTTANLLQKWTTADASWTLNPTGGRFGGGCIQNTGGAAGKTIVSPTIVSPAQQFCSGFYLKASAAPAALSAVALYIQSGGNYMSIALTPTGFAAYYDASLGTLRITSTINVCDNNWHWIEFKSDGFNNNGNLYVDNVAQGGTVSINNYTPNNVTFQSVAGITLSFDDLVHYDSNAGAPTMSGFPMGARQITVLHPVSDGIVQFATIVGGDGVHHYASINENPPDGNTSYVEDGTVGNQDLFTMGTYTTTATGGITSIVCNAYLENAFGGTINLEGIVKSGAAAQFNATPQATPLVYRTLQWSIPTDPNTSASWTVAGVNAAQWGYKSA